MLPRFLNDFIDQFSNIFLVTLIFCYLLSSITVYFLLKKDSLKLKVVNLFANYLFIAIYLYINKNNLSLSGTLIYLVSSIFFFFIVTKIILFILFAFDKIKTFFTRSKRNKIKLKATQSVKNKNHSDSPQRRSSPFGSPQVMTSFGLKVRSKSEVFIAEKLFEKNIEFKYEIPLSAAGKTYYPDFTLYIGKKEIYWEHFGMLSDQTYAEKTEIKIKWYNKHFPNKLIWTEESSQLMPQIHEIVEKISKTKRPPQSPLLQKQTHDPRGHAFQNRRI